MVTEQLGNLFRVRSGDGISIANLSAFGMYPVYGGNGVNGYTSNYNVENETMLIGRVGEKCGNVNITQSRSWVSDNALIVTPKAKYDIGYMRYLLEQINLNEYANRNAQPVISGQIIYAIETPYVEDVDEQGVIARNLRSFDTYIADLAELIEKKRDIRDGALEDLMSGRTRLEGQNISWVDIELGELATYRKGNYTGAKDHYISTENINQGFSGIKRYSSRDVVEGCSFYEADTLIANIRPYLRKVWYAEFSGICSLDVLALQPKPVVDSKYLYYLVANDRFINYVMNGGIKGIKMPRGDKKFILKYSVRIPSGKNIQAEIAQMITSMDNEIASLEAERDKMIQIREGAMDDLLTGRVRLIG